MKQLLKQIWKRLKDWWNKPPDDESYEDWVERNAW